MMSKQSRPVLEALQRAKRLKGVTVTSGVQGSPTGDRSITEMAQIAAAHEYGAGVTMRAFLRGASAAQRKVWMRMLRRAVRAQVRGQTAQVEVLIRHLAQQMRNDIQASIRDGDWAPNAPATIAAKGSDKPLIDTAQLLQSIRSAVEYGARSEVLA